MKIYILTILLIIFFIGGQAFAQTSKIIVPLKKTNNCSSIIISLFEIDNIDTQFVKAIYPESSNCIAVFSDVDSGIYIIQVAQPSGLEYTTNPVVIKEDETITLEEIVLPIKKEFTGATVIAKKQLFESDKNKLIVNVEGSSIFEGNNALELLSKTPGVFVTSNDEVMLNGMSSVQYQINGKQVYMNSVDMVNYLKNIDASLIKKIEIINNPGSKSDAEGSAGIVNIVLRKNVKIGLNGSVNFTHRQGWFARDIVGLNLSYRIKNFNLFTSVSLNKRNSFEQFEVTRNITSSNISLLQSSYSKFPVSSLLYNLGVDYDLTEKANIGLMLDFSNTCQNTFGHNNTITNTLGMTMLNTTRNNNTFINKYNYASANSTYQYKRDSIGSIFNVSANYAQYMQKGEQKISVEVLDSLDILVDNYRRTGTLPYKVNIIGADASYTHYFDTSILLQFGVKGVNTKSDNESSYFIEKNGIIAFEGDKSNRFNYNENIYAGFIELAKEVKKTNMNIGLRTEATDVDGTIKLPKDTTIGYDRIDFFPYIYIDQKFKNNHLISLSYNRRINRPDFYDLNPYPIYFDPYTYLIGNPSLKPEFANKLELKYSYKKAPLLTVNYSSINNAITLIGRQIDSTKTTYRTKDNIARKEILGFSTALPVPIKKWFISINYLSLSFTKFDGYFETLPISISRTTFVYYNNTQITLPNKWSLEIGGFYNKGYLAGLFDVGKMGAINIGVQKKLLSDKLNIKCNISDILYTQIDRLSFKYANVDAVARRNTDTRAITVTLRYNFGINPNNTKRQNDAIMLEKNRVKENEH